MCVFVQDDAINELLDMRLNGFVYAEEWEDIVKYMYNKDDSVLSQSPSLLHLFLSRFLYTHWRTHNAKRLVRV